MNLKIKNQLAADLKTMLFKLDLLKAVSELSYPISELLEKPKDTSFGQLALPVFGLAKALRLSPAQIAEKIKDELLQYKASQPSFLDYVEKIQAVSGFINFKFQPWFLTSSLELMMHAPRLGFTDRNKNQKLIIDYSSPNVAKPMNVGHLRATVIGQALRNLAETQGYEVIGLNHLGDWGVQFGKLAWAFTEWQAEYDFKGQPFKSLFDMYVRFHDEAENDKSLEDKGAETFIRLEKGDPEIVSLWKMFVAISMQEYQRLWDRLGVKHDLVRGESFYSDHLEATVQIVKDKGLLRESQGAYVVDLGEDMPPCLITKSDGASLYATRDLASALYRHEVLGCDLNLYVVGVDQTLHFKQVFKTLELMGYPWAKDCHHIAFGMYRFKDQGKMSTRKGRAIFLEDVLNKAVEMVKGIIETKNPSLAQKDLVAEQVGVGAVIFNDLVNDRVKDVDFDWDKILDFEGDSGPYVQYTSVRCLSVIEKFQTVFKNTSRLKSYTKSVAPLDKVLRANRTSQVEATPDSWGFPSEPEEIDLVSLLLSYEAMLTQAFEKFKPSVVANYLLDLAKAYNSFYNKHRIIDIDNKPLSAERVLLTEHTQKVLSAGLSVLNIQTPVKM